MQNFARILCASNAVISSLCATSLCGDVKPSLLLDASSKTILPLEHVVITLTAKVAESRPVPKTLNEELLGDPLKPVPRPELFIRHGTSDFLRVDDGYNNWIRTVGTLLPDAEGKISIAWDFKFTKIKVDELAFEHRGDYELFAKWDSPGGPVLSNVVRVKVAMPDNVDRTRIESLRDAAKFREVSSGTFDPRLTDQFVEKLETFHMSLGADNLYRPVLEKHVDLASRDLLSKEKIFGDRVAKMTDAEQGKMDQARKTAQECLDTGDVANAKAAFRALLAINAGDAPAWEALGDLSAREGKWMTTHFRYSVASRYHTTGYLNKKIEDAEKQMAKTRSEKK